MAEFYFQINRLKKSNEYNSTHTYNYKAVTVLGVGRLGIKPQPNMTRWESLMRC